MDEIDEIETLDEAPAPAAASLRSARITDDPVGVSEPLYSSRGNPTTAEAEVALAMLELSVKDCLRFLDADSPSDSVAWNAVDAAGWLFGPAGELACDAFLGDEGRDRVLALVRRVKRRVLADCPGLVGMATPAPAPAPAPRWWKVEGQLALFAAA